VVHRTRNRMKRTVGDNTAFDNRLKIKFTKVRERDFGVLDCMWPSGLVSCSLFFLCVVRGDAIDLPTKTQRTVVRISTECSWYHECVRALFCVALRESHGSPSLRERERTVGDNTIVRVPGTDCRCSGRNCALGLFDRRCAFLDRFRDRSRRATGTNREMLSALPAACGIVPHPWIACSAPGCPFVSTLACVCFTTMLAVVVVVAAVVAAAAWIAFEAMPRIHPKKFSFLLPNRTNRS